MNGLFDEELIQRLPLPLAQLYCRAHAAKTALERHLAAYFLWEAALKLLGSVAIVEYARLDSHDVQIGECLQNLSRPAVGHWWEFVRRLTPILAEAGVAEFAGLRDWLLGRSRTDLPRIAGLDALLLETLDGRSGARSTVRLMELFDRLVRYRNREIGHGAPGQRPIEFYNRMGWGLLAGLAELLGRLDVLLGRRLVYVTHVCLQDNRNWLIEATELRGETGRPLPPLSLPRELPQNRVPSPGRVYLLSAEGGFVELHPLLLYDPQSREGLLLNSRRGQQRSEYLSYTSGRVEIRADLGGEQRELLARVLGMPVAEENAKDWAIRSESEEGPPAPPPEPGQRQLGEFELLGELGEGGMGKVYRAWQPSLGRQVAVKEMLPTTNPKRLERFTREIQSLCRVDHPNLVKIFTSGSQGDTHFYAMELIEGATVAAVYDRLHDSGSTVADLGRQIWQETIHSVCQDVQQAEKRLASPPEAPAAPPARAAVTNMEVASPAGRGYIEQVVELIRQTAKAAHALHEAGVIHRDIKPGNIMVTADGNQAVLMDLGVAQLTEEKAGRLTSKGGFVGTLRYASPQQVRGEHELDHRTDVYSLGATLWELLTLRPLFGGDEILEAELRERIQHDEPERVRRFNPLVPRDLEAITLKCLEKKADRRYATARELADDLRRFQRGELVKARPVGRIERAYRWVRRRPEKVLAALLVLVVLSSGVGGYFLWNLKQQRDREVAHEPEINYEHDVVLAELLGVPPKLVRKPKDKKKYLAEGSPPIGPPQMVELENRRWRTRYSSLGNLIDLTCFGLDDAPALTSKGFHRWVARYDAKDNLVEEVHFGINGEVVCRSDGTYRGLYRYGPHGKLTEQRELGPNGRPVNNKIGWSKQLDTYDSSGTLVETTFWKANPKGKVVFWKRVDGKQKHKDGNLVVLELVNLTDDGIPQLWPEGNHRWAARCDSRGNTIEMAYFDQHRKPFVPKGFGYHRWVARYDARNNRLECASFGVTGELAFDENNSCRDLYRYDLKDNRTETLRLGPNGRPRNGNDGWARQQNSYDSAGTLVETTFWKANPKGRLIFWKRVDGKQKDKEGNLLVLELANLTDDGIPQLWPGGVYHRWVSRYDARGNETETAFFNIMGDPVALRCGCHHRVSRYDDKNNLVELAHFGRRGEPITCSSFGVFRSLYRRDSQGNVLETCNLGPNGRPHNGKDGWARQRNSYDSSGTLVETTFWKANPKGGLVFWKREDGKQKDKDGNPLVLELANLTRNGIKQLWPEAGYHRWRTRYNSQGKEIDVAYFGLMGEPVVLRPHKYHRILTRYNKNGQMVEDAHLDLEGGLIYCALCASFRTLWSYDENNKLTEILWLGPASRPRNGKDGWARQRNSYDSSGTLVETTFWKANSKGELVFWKRLAGKQKDKDGNPLVLELANLADDGRPQKWPGGHHRWAVCYNAEGMAIEEAYFGLKGEAVTPTWGYHRWVARYNARGRKVEEAHFDPKGEPALDKNGIFRILWRYDAHSNEDEILQMGFNGRPMNNRDGWARCLEKRDSSGKVVERTFWLANRQGQLLFWKREDAWGRPIK